ncbi:hypothetical protein TWF569_004194 [Orbilia oligospora]|uniref:phosphoserine phosphatase n=1 Tax=Orbilia oligospora TaxID=2813651 RepID=A0A7C8J0X4_ORBOL|nr:hypothetical protein TWF706_002849 [Orbilia oligospora]KAF3086750.1 hypothetical protein TWF102_010936 [Orbilia oligospora]KAF3095784.1 hypothetical protein TWF103_010015 [Orbilia oligospora]KAF3138386.1 hypothetical protein TWF594_007207 [Orbilia oligospora]KAF3139144.1 hypothetical protein TWF703_004084 [Orbilia oligospora]
MSNFTATLLLSSTPRKSPPSTPPPQTIDSTYITETIRDAFSCLCTKVYLNLLLDTWKPLSTDSLSTATAVEVTIIDPTSSGIQIRALKGYNELKEFEYIYNVDVALQEDSVFRKHKRLVVFDMDSTLIEQEVIDELAAFVGVKDKVAAITESAMRGELDFTASLRSRAALLNGVPSNVFTTLKSNGTITFTPGAHELCKALKKLGCKLAVLSGGFQPLAEWVKSSLGLDYAYANTLEVSADGQSLTGVVLGDIVNAERKATLLKEIALKEGVDLRQVVAVGDGANDLVMMREAGFGVAFNAKPKVQEEAPSHLNSRTLRDILYLFGFTAAEVEELVD